MPILKRSGWRDKSLEKPWPLVIVVSWLLVTAALASAAVTSRNIGKPTWWLGTQNDPAFPLFWVLPFLAPIVAIFVAFVAGRWAPFAGVGAALYIGAIAILDIESTPAVALIEVIVAISALLVSIASLAGRRNST
jgi:hypothetical protein